MVVGMMVGHCHSLPHNHHRHAHHSHHHHNLHRTGGGGESTRDEQYINGGGNMMGSSSNNGSSSEYSLAMSSETGERSRHQSTVSLLDSIERRTQRTYRYGIGLVCIGATLNWLGFAQGTTYIDPLRYLGVACVLTGSFCVCLAMCRWLGRPISVSGHHVTNLEEERSNGDVHVINVAVPMYAPSLHEEYRPTKPPDYEQIIAGEIPPPYDEAIKLTPGAFFGTAGNSSGMGLTVTVDGGHHHLFASHFSSQSPSLASPSHTNAAADLTRALLLDSDNHDNETCTTTTHGCVTSTNQRTPHLSFLRNGNSCGGDSRDPPPAYEPSSPRHSISSCSSSAPLIPNSASRFDLPPSFTVRHLFVGGSSCSSPSSPPTRNDALVNINEHLHEIVFEDANLVSVPSSTIAAVDSHENNNNVTTT